MLNKTTVGIIITLTIACYSCALKPGGGSGAASSGTNLFETFYVGDGGTQYYLKPLTFINENKEKVFLDATFKYKKSLDETANVKISVISPKLIKDIEKFTISNSSGEKEISFNNIEFMFNERTKNLFLSRFSMETNLSELKRIYNNPEWIITIDKLSPFKPKGKAKKSIEKLDHVVFSLM